MIPVLAFITGASSGIGEALAKLLAANGVSLILAGRDADRLEKVARICRQKVSVETLLADLATEDGRSAHSKMIWERGPDLIVNNAGFGVYGHSLSHTTAMQENLLEVNGQAVMVLSLEGARKMIAAKKKGTIVNISSAAAFQVFPFFAAYAASKAFVNAFSQALDVELSPYGIRVLVSCPGMVRTQFGKRASGREHPPAKEGMRMDVDFAAQKIWRQIKMGKGVVIFDWRYRLLTFLSRLIPQKLLSKILCKTMNERAGKRELLLDEPK